MPTSNTAISDFLGRRVPSPFSVKHLTADECIAAITRVYGVEPYFRTPCRLPQLHGLLFALRQRRSLMLYDMRMGKTKLALDWVSHLALADEWQGKGLIIVPSPVLTSVWVNQAAQHSFLRVKTVTSTDVQVLAAALDEPDVDLIVIAWSSLQGMFTVKRPMRNKRTGKERTQLVPDFELLDAMASCFDLMIVDEIHTAKEHTSLRFQIAAALNTKTRYFMGLTGTPWGRSPFTAWTQAFLTDRGSALSRNYYFFEQAFGKKTLITDTRTAWVFDKDKLEILQKKIAPFSLSYKHSEQGKDVIESVIGLDLIGDQRKAYIDAINKIIETTKEGAKQSNVNNFIRLRQIASGYLPFVTEEGEKLVHEFRSNIKRAWLQDLVEEMALDIKGIIFHDYTRTGEIICEVLKSAGVPFVWLSGATKDRTSTIREFEHGEARWIVVQSQSGSMGIELLKADYQCFYEAPLSAINRSQAERRAQGEARGGHVLLIDDLVCAPVERRILQMTREGKDMLKEVYRDPSRFFTSLRL